MNNKEKLYLVKQAGWWDNQVRNFNRGTRAISDAWSGGYQGSDLQKGVNYGKNQANTAIKDTTGVDLQAGSYDADSPVGRFAESDAGQVANDAYNTVSSGLGTLGDATSGAWDRLKGNASEIITDHNNADYRGAYKKRNFGRNVANIRGRFTGEGDAARFGRGAVNMVDRGVTAGLTSLQSKPVLNQAQVKRYDEGRYPPSK